MDETQEKSKSGCLKFAGIGCVVMLGGLILVVGLVALNFDRIRESSWYQSATEVAGEAKAEIGAVLELRAELANDYPAGNILVNSNFNYANGVTTRTLSVELENPSFAVPEDENDRWAAAKGIARRVSELHPEIGKYDQIEIILGRKAGSMVTFKTSKTYAFPVSDFVTIEEKEDGTPNP